MAWANVYVLPVPNGPRQKGKGNELTNENCYSILQKYVYTKL